MFESKNNSASEKFLAPTSIHGEVGRILNEKGIQAPPIKLHVAFIYHGTRADARDLKSELNKCDIFIPELSHTPLVRFLHQELAHGNITPQEFWKRNSLDPVQYKSMPFRVLPGFYKELLSMIHNSKKIIRFVDVPLESVLCDLLRDPLVKELPRLEKELHREREEYMLNQLPKVLADVVEHHSALQPPHRRSPLRVFMFLGAAHYPLWDKLRDEEGVTSEMSVRGFAALLSGIIRNP